MNVTTMGMTKEEAREKLKAVRAQLHRRVDAEYSQLEQAYASVARGMRLLNIADAFSECPLDEKGRPKIAIARADQPQVKLNQGWSGTPHYRFDTTFNNRRRQRSLNLSIITRRAPYKWPEGYSLVPIVPPEHRKGHALHTHFILWEVEQWSDSVIRAIADRDPYLLRHVGGDLYAIVAEWDLTDIERAVMAGRARQ